MRARAEQEVIRHKRGGFWTADVVPCLQPGIEHLAPRLRQSAPIHGFKSDVHLPSRHEHEEVGEQQTDPSQEVAYELRGLARVSVAERATPDTPRSDQDD